MQDATNEPTFNERVGKRLREYREDRKWSQRRLAEVLEAHGLKLDPSAITRIELGQRDIKLHEAKALASALRVKIDELVKHDDDDPRQEMADELDWADERRQRAEAALSGVTLSYTRIVQLVEEHPDLIEALASRAGVPATDTKQFLAFEAYMIAESGPHIRLAVDEEYRELISQILIAIATSHVSPEPADTGYVAQWTEDDAELSEGFGDDSEP